MRKHHILHRHQWVAAGLAVVLGALAPGVHADDKLPSRGPIPFSVYDKDGNGLVSEAEFNAARSARMTQRAAEGMPMMNAANAPTFAEIDANGDGNLTREELAAGQQRMGRHGMAPGAGDCPSMTTFEDIDTNGDGAISRDEFAAHQQQRHPR